MYQYQNLAEDMGFDAHEESLTYYYTNYGSCPRHYDLILALGIFIKILNSYNLSCDCLG